MKANSKVQCPKCGRTCDRGLSLHYCGYCRMQFDDDPDEGGTYHDRNPAARLEREERRERNKRYPHR